MSDAIETIEKPADLPKAPLSEAVIFAMPEAYRHGKRPMAAPPKLVPPSVASAKEGVAPMPAPAPLKKPIARPDPKGGGKGPVVAVIVVLLVVIAAAAFYFLRAKPVPVTPSIPATTIPTPPTPEPIPPVLSPQSARPGTDSDSDGLTDNEETFIYRTDPRLPDTDSDGFLDGNEVFHRYDPSAVLSKTLLESGLVKRFDAAAYSVLYPAGWEAKTDLDTVTFTAVTGETVTLSLLPGTLDAWAIAQTTMAFTRVTTKNGYAEDVSNNQLLAALDATGKGTTPHVIKAVYDAGGKATVDYLQTFKMMLNSVVVR